MTDPHQISGLVTGASLSSISIVLGAQVDALVIGPISAVFASPRRIEEKLDGKVDK